MSNDNNNDDKWKSGAEGIAMLGETDWGRKPKKPKVKKQRRIKKLLRVGVSKFEKWQAGRKERKEIYKTAYKRAEKAAIITKARREARAKHAPRTGRRSGGILASGGLFDLPSGFTGATLFGPAPKKKIKKTTGRRRPRKVVYY